MRTARAYFHVLSLFVYLVFEIFCEVVDLKGFEESFDIFWEYWVELKIETHLLEIGFYLIFRDALVLHDGHRVVFEYLQVVACWGYDADGVILSDV